MPRTKTFLTILLLAVLLLGCAPRPPSWPPTPEKFVETSPWYVDVARFQQSAHGNMACAVCHPDIQPGAPGAAHPDPAKLTLAATELYDYKTCASCHPQEYAAYQQGVHAGAQEPTCGHCHNAHYAYAETRLELLTSVSQACGTCHPEALQTYHHNYHGKAALLGYEKTATCTDCHGAHTVLALFEADESIPACRRCHLEATASFVSYRIHAQATLNPDPDDPRASNFRTLFWVTLFFSALVVGVLGFFYTHTGLWFLRSLHERLRGKHHD